MPCHLLKTLILLHGFRKWVMRLFHIKQLFSQFKWMDGLMIISWPLTTLTVPKEDKHTIKLLDKLTQLLKEWLMRRVKLTPNCLHKMDGKRHALTSIGPGLNQLSLMTQLNKQLQLNLFILFVNQSENLQLLQSTTPLKRTLKELLQMTLEIILPLELLSGCRNLECHFQLLRLRN